MREDDTGPQELITLNNGEQIKNNLCRMGEISRGSSESETFIGHKIYLQNLTYIMWGEEEEGEWGVSGIWACACVLGEGRIGVKVRKKRRQRQTKRKSEEKGVGIGREQFLKKKKKKKCINFIIPLWKIYFYHKSLWINCAQLLEMAILLVEVRVVVAVTNSTSFSVLPFSVGSAFSC